MDDPISALDARLREETRVELKRIQRDLGHTLVYVTHDQEEAMSIADRMAIFEEGTIRQIGKPSEIYDHPASQYVARLLGSPAINLLDLTGNSAGEGTIQLGGVPDGATGIGIRPEDLKAEPWSEGKAGAPATVFEVEPLGGFTVVTLSAGDKRLRSLMRGQPQIAVDSKVSLTCDPRRVHFFKLDGQALAPAAAAGA
jgi:multiple sugar transport system ATP-binding protein